MQIRIHLALLAAILATSAAAQSGSQANFDKMMSHDGLQRVEVKGLSLAYRRPEATLAGYKRVWIEPVQVAFAKNWNPSQTGSRIPVSASAREDIRNGLAKLVREQFEKALQGQYPIAGAAAPDVLRLRINIANLYINAPEGGGASTGPSYNFVMSAGEMTLFLELFDSESGQILARVVDREEGRSPNMARMAGQVTNVAAAEVIAAEWARIMRAALDRARAMPQKK